MSAGSTKTASACRAGLVTVALLLLLYPLLMGLTLMATGEHYFFDVALGPQVDQWAPALAVLAVLLLGGRSFISSAAAGAGHDAGPRPRHRARPDRQRHDRAGLLHGDRQGATWRLPR